MPASDYLRAGLLDLVFFATNLANIADNAASSPLTNLFIGIHTADPTTAGAQNSNECAYTSYARQTVARSAVGFNRTTNVVTFDNDVNFPIPTGGTLANATHVSIGVASSGATNMLCYGTITPNLAIALLTTPTVLAGTTITLT